MGPGPATGYVEPSSTAARWWASFTGGSKETAATRLSWQPSTSTFKFATLVTCGSSAATATAFPKQSKRVPRLV